MIGASGQSAAFVRFGAAGAAIVALGLFAYTQRSATPEVDDRVVAAAPTPDIPVPVLEPSSEPAGRVTAEATEGPAPRDAMATPAPATPLIAEAPALDVVRIDPNGFTVVAGRAPQGERVVLRVDGTEIARADVDARGDFVAFTELPTVDAPRVLTVERANGPDAAVSEAIIVAPMSADVASETASTPAIATVPPDRPGVGPEVASDGPPPLQAPAEADMDTRVTARAPDLVRSAGPRLFRAGPDGVVPIAPETTVDPDVPPVPALGLDAISYDADGDVVLAGRGGVDTDLRIYLDNRPIQTVRIAEAGAWRSPLPDVEEGVYTLRIDALDKTGAVTSRIETPFQRVAAPPPGAEGASTTVVTVQPGSTLWGISERYFGDGAGRRFVQIFEANRALIRDPDLIYPGQVFTLPALVGQRAEPRDG